MKSLKAAGGTAYNDMIGILDSAVSMAEACEHSRESENLVMEEPELLLQRAILKRKSSLSQKDTWRKILT